MNIDDLGRAAATALREHTATAVAPEFEVLRHRRARRRLAGAASMSAATAAAVVALFVVNPFSSTEAPTALTTTTTTSPPPPTVTSVPPTTTPSPPATVPPPDGPVVEIAPNGWGRVPLDPAVFGSGGNVRIAAAASSDTRYVLVGSTAVNDIDGTRLMPVAWYAGPDLQWRQSTFATGVDGEIFDVVRYDGGFLAVGTAGRDAAVWTSPNGGFWDRHDIPAAAPGGRASMAGVAVAGDSLVAVGVETYSDPSVEEEDIDPAVWVAGADGTNWELVTNGAAFGVPGFNRDGLGEIAGVSWTRHGVVAVGWYGGGPAAWIDAGSGWERVAIPTDGRLLGVAESGASIVAWGSTGFHGSPDSDGLILLSDDGLTWTAAEGDFSGSGISDGIQVISALFAPPGGPLVAVGSDQKVFTSVGGAAVWTSPDGRVWERTPHDDRAFGALAQDGYSVMTDVVPFADGLLAVGYSGDAVDDGRSFFCCVESATMWINDPTVTAPSAVAVDVSLDGALPLPRRTIAFAPWGSGPSEVGMSQGGAGPCCFDVASNGTVVIVDTENLRVLAFPLDDDPYLLDEYGAADFVPAAVATTTFAGEDVVAVLGFSNEPNRPHDLITYTIGGIEIDRNRVTVGSARDLRAGLDGFWLGTEASWRHVAAANGTVGSLYEPQAVLPLGAGGLLSWSTSPSSPEVAVRRVTASGRELSFLLSEASIPFVAAGSAEDTVLVHTPQLEPNPFPRLVLVMHPSGEVDRYLSTATAWTDWSPYGGLRMKDGVLYVLSTTSQGVEILAHELYPTAIGYDPARLPECSRGSWSPTLRSAPTVDPAEVILALDIAYVGLAPCRTEFSVDVSVYGGPTGPLVRGDSSVTVRAVLPDQASVALFRWRSWCGPTADVRVFVDDALVASALGTVTTDGTVEGFTVPACAATGPRASTIARFEMGTVTLDPVVIVDPGDVIIVRGLGFQTVPLLEDGTVVVYKGLGDEGAMTELCRALVLPDGSFECLVDLDTLATPDPGIYRIAVGDPANLVSAAFQVRVG